MKRLIVGAALMALAGGACAAEWKLVGKEAHLDDTTGGLILAVSKGPDYKGLPSVVVKNSADCDDIEKENPMPGAPVIIQDTRVSIIMMCTNSNSLIFFPETAAGRKLLLDRITSDKNVSIVMPSGDVVWFKNHNGSKAAKRVFSLNDEPI
ncbi:hypothetical protein [Zymobacter palmae]|uniref:hypothetical protein n=1 Tax=Zymobacter palmae TaxID=33074 RepID=UPI000488A652|nr:hypothetical protein [Zymobacter palmae]